MGMGLVGHIVNPTDMMMSCGMTFHMFAGLQGSVPFQLCWHACICTYMHTQQKRSLYQGDGIRPPHWNQIWHIAKQIRECIACTS
jgi:hypothetical protein